MGENKISKGYQVQLDNFEGPLDLLLHLIDKNKIDIYDIPIAEITDQYLEYLEVAQDMDLEIASEFLVLAATLISIKAKMLLPKPVLINEDEPEDPRAELIARLLEYKQYKEVAKVLAEQATSMTGVLTRTINIEELSKQFAPVNPVSNLSLEDLYIAFQKVLTKVDEVEPTLELVREEFSVHECMIIILNMLEEKDSLLFYDLFKERDSKSKIISMFLAILELVKLRQIDFQQRENFAQLWLFKKD